MSPENNLSLPHDKTKPTIVIYGGAGYIGKNLLYFLTRNTDYNITVVDYFCMSGLTDSESLIRYNEDLKKISNGHRVNYVDRDLSIQETLSLSENVQIVINLAGIMPRRKFTKEINEDTLERTYVEDDGDSPKMVSYNCAINSNILEAVLSHGKIKGVLFASSMAVYDKNVFSTNNGEQTLSPDTFYGRSKMICENMLEDALTNKPGLTDGCKHVSIRIPNVVGNGFNEFTRPVGKTDILTGLKKSAEYNQDFVCSDPTSVRTYIDVRDIAAIFGELAINLINDGQHKETSFLVDPAPDSILSNEQVCEIAKEFYPNIVIEKTENASKATHVRIGQNNSLRTRHGITARFKAVDTIRDFFKDLKNK